jgi:M6 family metalloprotease-like protein
MPMPFVDKSFTFTQPDGTKIAVVGTGNQHKATFRTPEGLPVLRDPASGYFHFADLTDRANPRLLDLRVGAVPPLGLSPPPPPLPGDVEPFVALGLPEARTRWRQRREEQRVNSLAEFANGVPTPAPPQRQTVGTFVGLCLLVAFPDEPPSLPPSEVEDFCNRPGYAGFGNNGSVRDYFFETSGGKLTYTNVVAPWYVARHPKGYYTDESIADGVRARELVAEALSALRAQGFDFSKLTVDNQRSVYAINVFYAGFNTNGWPKGLWPQSSSLGSPMQLMPGKFAYDYQITDLPGELSLGTFCHENGHMICDFPDLYDYDQDSYGVGTFCLMCFGCNPNPKNPTHVGAYLKQAAGWASRVKPIVPGGGPMSLAAGQNEFAILRRNRTQYFIVENRVRQGRDSALPDEGLAIWKVDEAGNNRHQQMTPQFHYECSLMQADGNHDLELKVNQGDGSDLFKPGAIFSPASTPNSSWWDGSSSSLTIKDIGAPGATITFST